jgi:A/G-specific adenine glycosylase
MSISFTRKLLSWYAEQERNIPWRGVSDPYVVWVSEIMAQQTRIETVIPYFKKWFDVFPDVQALANAKQQDVLKLWEGLGYYSRARNMHRAAQVIVSDFDGQIPSDVAALKTLPGIGDYTSAAIASLAFGLDEAALDGNIRRVLSRIFDVTEPLGTREAERQFLSLAKENLPGGQAGDYNQALMDLGATVCVPRNPRCEECPVIEFCQAHALGIQSQRPVKKEKSPSPHYTVAAAVIHRNEDVLIAQRAEDGLLGGMWEFPGGKQKPGESLETCLKREICEELGVDIKVGKYLGVYEHAYSHFRVTLHAYHSMLLDGEPQLLEHSDLCWASPTRLSDYPMGKIDRQIADALIHSEIL